jgi:hypothetical protein
MIYIATDFDQCKFATLAHPRGHFQFRTLLSSIFPVSFTSKDHLACSVNNRKFRGTHQILSVIHT